MIDKKNKLQIINNDNSFIVSRKLSVNTGFNKSPLIGNSLGNI